MIRPGVFRIFRLPLRTTDQVRADADAELEAFLEERIEYLVRRGISPEAARAEALTRLGAPLNDALTGVRLSAERREQRRRLRDAIRDLRDDVRFAWRQMRRAPLLTMVAIATLALGIGANTAIFSVVHHLLVAPFPFEDSNRLAWINTVDTQENAMILLDAQTVSAWRARAHSLEAISSVKESDVELRDGQRIETVKGGAMSANLLPMLGVRSVLGRGFAPMDERSGAVSVALLGYEEWQTRFGGRLDVIGQTITVDSAPRVIVGVLPAGFIVPFSAAPRSVWLPLGDRAGALSVIAKVRKGVAIDVVNRELTAIAREVPGNGSLRRQTAQAWRQQDLYGWLRSGVLLLFASVGVVLLIACANVANLMLVRAWSRQREFAIRTALGAGRMRLVRQLLAECLPVAVAGGAAGLALAWAAVRVFILFRPAELGALDQVRIEPVALAWTMLLALGTGLVFGMVPAVFATSRSMTDGLKEGARDTEGRGRARAYTSSIIVAEIALSVMLLVSAGLLVQSFRAMATVPLGFNPSGLTSVTVRVGRAIPRSHHRAMMTALLQRLRETPGLHGAMFASSLPPEIFADGSGLQTADRPASDAPQIATSGAIAVQSGFFKTAGIRIRGMTFDGDSTGTDSVPPNEIIVNERLARRLWPHADAIGQRVRLGKTMNTVVGVANDLTIAARSGDQFELQFYTPWFELNGSSATVLFRSALGASATDVAVHEAMRSVSSQMTVESTTTSDKELRAMLAPMKFATALVSSFALVALFLSVVGLYGVIASAVSQRTREIGVRIALGAQPGDIARLVLVRVSVLLGAGTLGGIALSAAASRVLQGYLYGVSGLDPLTYIATVVLLGATALLAAYVPMRRAMRVNPVVALAAE